MLQSDHSGVAPTPPEHVLPPRTDWSRVEAELVPLLGDFASAELASWERRRPAAVGPLRAATSERIYAVKPETVRPLLNPPEKEWPFPIGARKAEWSIPEVEDMTGGLPLSFGFHAFVESHGRAPTWRETRDWFMAPEQGPIFYLPAWRLYREGRLRDGTRLDAVYTSARWQKAITWRIGNAYLSFLREMDFLARMIHIHGVPLRTQPLADAVLKVDFWFGRFAMCLFIPNQVKQRKTDPLAASGIVHPVAVGGGTCWGEAPDGSRRKLAWNEINTAPERELAALAGRIRGAGNNG